jgi:LacI family transcriptional regulator
VTNVGKKTDTARHRPAVPRIAVLVDTSSEWGRGIVRGIKQYTDEHEHWQIFVEARGMEEHLRLPKGWRGQGIIARVGTSAMARELQAHRLPVVNVSSIELAGVHFPRVITDLRASAFMAAQHFLDRGFRHFAYFSLIGLSYVATHKEAFSQAVAGEGCKCAVYEVTPVVGAEPDWNLDLGRIGEWLRKLPKPVGVLTWNNSSAREVMLACEIAGLDVPTDVAVMSGTYDELLSEVLRIPLSGIQPNALHLGHLAAEMLDLLMRGKTPPRDPVLVRPLRVLTRLSTETLAVDDVAMIKAVKFIQENAAHPIGVEEVARAAGLSRRAFERRFQRVFGRTPAHDIRRAHLELAKKLLAETDLPMPQIAEQAAFNSAEYMAYVFRDVLGKTPRSFREEAQGRASSPEQG